VRAIRILRAQRAFFAAARPLKLIVRRNAVARCQSMSLNRKTASMIMLCVIVGFLVLLTLSNSSWPFWAQAALAVAVALVGPLLSALGVLGPLGLEGIPGSRFNARHMFTGIGFLAGAFLWVVVLVRLIPNPSNAGILFVIVPTFLALATAIFFFIRGTI
jgi:hypothetical protein